VIEPAARALLLVACCSVSAARAGEVRTALGGQDVSVRVKSWLEIRDDRLVRQQWDLSCGAAALSTILMHHFGADHSELAIAASILANTDPATVRARGGFSLLDLKRFSDAVGFPAEGYGGLTLDDLEAAEVPAILPVRIHGLDHFVVLRERIAGKVVIGDPAFGNLVVADAQFLEMWQSGIALFVHPPAATTAGHEPLSLERLGLPVPDLNHVYRVSRGVGPLPPKR
jgi:predicted double-glycine peptidase